MCFFTCGKVSIHTKKGLVSADQPSNVTVFFRIKNGQKRNFNLYASFINGNYQYVIQY